MSEFILLISIPLLGLWALHLGPEHRRGGAVTATVYGLVLLAVEMLVFSIAGARWSILGLIVLPILLAALPVSLRRPAKKEQERRRFLAHPSLLIAGAVSVFFAGSILSALATSFDLLFFWGTKGQRFALERGIDWAFLSNPDHRVMHPDYPPLVPLIYAWTALKEGHLNWTIPLLFTILLFVLSWLAVYLFAREPLGPRRAGFAAGLYSALLALPALHGALGGNADMALIFFETVALCVLTLTPLNREARWLATVGLIGVVMTKVEGLPFVILFIPAAMMVIRAGWRERLNAALQLSILPALAAITWAVMARTHGFLDAYGGTVYSGPKLAPLADIARKLFLEASYGAWYLPWVVVLILMIVGRWKAALPHFLISAGFIAFLLYAYTHMEGDPSLWIGLSANRVLMTPLATLFFGALAATLHRGADGVAHEHGDGHRSYSSGHGSNP